MISPRRYGKTSLIINVLEHLDKEGLFTFYFDLYKVASLRELLEAYAKGLARSCTTRVERFSEFVKDIFPRLRPKIIIGRKGPVELVFGSKKNRETRSYEGSR